MAVLSCEAMIVWLKCAVIGSPRMCRLDAVLNFSDVRRGADQVATSSPTRERPT
jgi:hypothetical protein